jgi:hypothetical protein
VVGAEKTTKMVNAESTMAVEVVAMAAAMTMMTIVVNVVTKALNMVDVSRAAMDSSQATVKRSHMAPDARMNMRVERDVTTAAAKMTMMITDVVVMRAMVEDTRQLL